ncbi:MAG: hypothetical protein Kow0090_00920 [Myxococcota bacterium]
MPDNEKLDCLLVHTPKPRHPLHPLGETRFINFLPIGLVSIANFVREKGFSTRILHLGLYDENGVEPNFRRALERFRPAVIGFSLHWHHQSDVVIQNAALARKALPHSTIVLGGYTASFFAQEILSSYPFIDAVVKGEGELPLVEILKSVAANGKLNGTIPNLVYREEGKVISSQNRWVADDAELSAFRFSDLSPLLSAEHYNRQHMYIPNDKSLRKIILERETVKLHILSIGRGCAQNCIFCGGGCKATGLVSGRHTVSLRDPIAVADEIVESQKFGFTGLFSDFDIPQNAEYIIRLIETIGGRAGKIHWRMNLWNVPQTELVKAFAKITSPGSALYISPQSGSEAIREKIGGVFYTNSELERFALSAKRLKIPLFLFFSYGLPGEDEKSYAETLKLARRLHKIHSGIRCFGYPIELDPASPLFVAPERFGIKAEWRTFEDYRRYHATGEFHLGYALESIKEDEIFERRCREMCIIDNRWGPYACAALRRLQKTPGGTAALETLLRLLKPWQSRWLKTGHS